MFIYSSEPSRAAPSRAEPSRAAPSRAEPSREKPRRAEPRGGGGLKRRGGRRLDLQRGRRLSALKTRGRITLQKLVKSHQLTPPPRRHHAVASQVHPPLLFAKRKFELRVFVTISSVRPLVVDLYTDGVGRRQS